MSAPINTPGAAGTASEGAYQGTQQQANSSATPIETLPPCLECPTRNKPHPSFVIRETGHGAVLIQRFSSREALGDILTEIGLSLDDLFADLDRYKVRRNRRGRYWDYRAMLKMLRYESTIVLIAANDMAHQGELPEADRQRLIQAATRIARVAEIAK